MLNLNTSPYFDDYSEDKKFYRILFRPGIAVQARELTQLQTQLQNQISIHGNHIFKEGAMVIPGQLSIDMKNDFVKLQPTYGGNSIETTLLPLLEGATVLSQSGLAAIVTKAVSSESTDPPTLYIRYTNAGDNGVTKVFQANEILSIRSTTNVALNSQLVQVASLSPVGRGTIATIERGVYYTKGFFVLADSQSVVIDKYSSTPTARIGLSIDESVVTPEDDETLLDNAQGSYNFAAPGAHRYYIDLALSSRPTSSTDDENFIELARVEGGSIKRLVNRTEYSELEKTLARRTFDESGDYTVRNFAIDVREHRNNSRGQWVQNTAYQLGDVVTSNGNTYTAKSSGISSNTAPNHDAGQLTDGTGGVLWEYDTNPYFNRGIYQDGDESKLAIGLEPGKAYIRGYEVEKIATEYIDVNKARSFESVENGIIPATVGNYVFVTNINNLPPIASYGIVTLYDRLVATQGVAPAGATAVGQARVRFIEWDRGTIGQSTAVYKLGLFDIQMNDDAPFDTRVKSVYFNVDDNADQSFTANIELDATRLVGSATASNSTTVTGNGTSFLVDVQVGDYIRLGTEVRRVAAKVGQGEITVDSAVTVTNVTIDVLYTSVREPDNVTLVFPFPHYAIRSVEDTIYTVYQAFDTAQASGAVGDECDFTISTTGGTFASAADNDNYIVVDDSTGNVVVPLRIEPAGASATIVLSADYANHDMRVVAAINRSLSQKTKTLTLTSTTITTAAAATRPTILLGKADLNRVISIKMDSGTFADPTGDYTIDILDRYEFDTGQRPTHYDIGRINLRPSYVPPTAPIRIEFEFFAHGVGDYFTKESYPTDKIAYRAIPPFSGVELRDTIDFRPRISDDGLTFENTSLAPKRGSDVTTDFSYFLARKTKVAMSFGGEFFIVDGVSSLDPGEPTSPSEGMVLYTLTLEPYTFGTTNSNVVVESYDNKRYTMRDIGRLEKRIDNLEYYTSLSLLEQQTESLNITDEQGLTRFKNGFIVDNFTGHNTGDESSQDYLCSIDMEKGELRPFFSMQNLRVLERFINDEQRDQANYKLYGDVITLPLDDDTPHVPLIDQPYASRIENINPFAIFTFLGAMDLTPATDDWFEVNRRPDLVIELEGNFNTVKSLAEKAGVLGTVWNSWQTQWTGVSSVAREMFAGRYSSAWGANLGAGTRLSTSGLNARFGNGPRAHGWARREVTVQTTATNVGQRRTGVRTTLVTKIDRQVVADRVLSSAAIPYIRSRNVLVQVRGLKPNTKFFPFFDNVDVSQFCTPSQRLAYTPIAGQTNLFDVTTNVGGLAAEAPRRIAGDSQVCLTRGDIIVGQTSGATAVVVGKEYNPDTGAHALHVVNVRGTFQATEILVGSISESQGSFTSLDAASSTIVTNFSGDVSLLFNIPNTDSIRFRTGVREFKLVDTPVAEGEFTSRGRQNYNAQGVLETRQQTVNAVRNAELAVEQLTENRVIVQTSQRVVADTGWYDPLAQTFLVEQKGGAFLSKVDIFFATKDPKIPVNLEIREVVNGYPGKLVLPFSKVSLKPEQVNISNSTVLLNGVQTRSYDTPTTFVFSSPVYVQDNTEYAIVLSSDSNNYKCWISNVGDPIPGSSRTISEQPYQGVLFKSQNASTWTADQMQDLKFTIYRAKFKTNTNSSVQFVNDAIPLQQLDFDPFEVRAGVEKVRVYQRDHGMPAGSLVQISDLTAANVTGSTGTGTITTTSTSTSVTGNGTSFDSDVLTGTLLYTAADVLIGQVASVTNATTLVLDNPASVALTGQVFKFVNPIAGIPVNQLYGQHTVADVDMDSYTIEIATAPTQSGYFGGTTVRATRNLQFDEIQPSIQMQNFPETTTSVSLRSLSGKSVDGSETPYVASPFLGVIANESNRFPAPRMIGSEINEATELTGEEYEKSLVMSIQMNTTIDNVSPIIDTQRLSVIAISNKVDAPTEVNTNVGGLDDVTLLSGNTTISFAGNKIVTSNSAAGEALAAVVVGKYLKISGTTGGTNNGTVLVTAVELGATTSITTNHTFTDQASGASVTIQQAELFVSEIAPVGSSTYSKYVTRQINLASDAEFIRIRFAASIPVGADVDVYYKTSTTGTTVPFEEVPYTEVLSDSPIRYVQNGSDEFVDLDFSTGDIPAFDSLQVKLVMRSTNTSAVPRIRDLRVIAAS